MLVTAGKPEPERPSGSRAPIGWSIDRSPFPPLRVCPRARCSAWTGGRAEPNVRSARQTAIPGGGASSMCRSGIQGLSASAPRRTLWLSSIWPSSRKVTALPAIAPV